MIKFIHLANYLLALCWALCQALKIHNHEQVTNRTCPHGALKGTGNQINNGINKYLRAIVKILTKDLQGAL